MTPAVAPSSWWRARGVQIALALHIVYLFGLCQIQLSDHELARVLGSSSEPRTVSAVVERGGVLGTASLYFGVHEQVQLYHRYAEVFLRGRDPKRAADDPVQGHLLAYRDVSIEYQPGKVLLMVPPALLSSRYEVYLPCFVVWTGLIYLGAVLGAWHLVGNGSAEQLSRVLWWSLAMLIAFGPYVAGHLDQAVALICVLGWMLFRRGWHGGSPGWFAAFGSLTAVGVLVKISPGVLLPAGGIALLFSAHRPRWRDAVLVAAGFIFTLGSLHALSFVKWGDGYLASFTFHMQRGIQIESTWAGLLEATRGFLGPLSAEYNFGSYHLVTPYTPLVRMLFPVTWFSLVGAIAWRVWSVRGRTEGDPVPLLTLVLLLGLVLTSKVFSFNYLLWITPLVPALAERARGWVPVNLLYVGALVLTQFYRVYDYAYAKITMPWQPVLVLNLRNLTLLILLGWLLWRLPQLLRGQQRERVGE
jgi:hypothetical protein